MQKKYFTATDALALTAAVVFTIFMLMAFFPHPHISRKGHQNNSMNQAKQIMCGIAGYFTDVRKKSMPTLEQALGPGYPIDQPFICPAKGGTYGYAAQIGTYNIIDTHDPIFAKASSKLIDSTFLWKDVNNADSPIITTSGPMGTRKYFGNIKLGYRMSHSLQPVAFGDGHVEVSGRE